MHRKNKFYFSDYLTIGALFNYRTVSNSLMSITCRRRAVEQAPSGGIEQ